MLFSSERWDSQKNDSSVLQTLKMLNYYCKSTKISRTNSYMFIHNDSTRRKEKVTKFNLQLEYTKRPYHLQTTLIIVYPIQTANNTKKNLLPPPVVLAVLTSLPGPRWQCIKSGKPLNLKHTQLRDQFIFLEK